MFFADFILTVLSLKKRSKFKGTVVRDRNVGFFQRVCTSPKASAFVKSLLCSLCVWSTSREPGGNQILGRCERNPDPKSRFLPENPVLPKKLRRRPKKLRRRPKKFRSRPN